MPTPKHFPSEEPELALRQLSSSATLTAAMGLGLVLLGLLLLVGLARQIGGQHPVALALLALLPGLPGAVVLRFGLCLRREPWLYLWRDGSLALASPLGWKVLRREQLACHEVRRAPRRRVGQPRGTVRIVYPKGWLSPLALGQEQLSEADAALVDGWIARHLPERKLGGPWAGQL